MSSKRYVCLLSNYFKEKTIVFKVADDAGSCAGIGSALCWPEKSNTTIPNENKINGTRKSWKGASTGPGSRAFNFVDYEVDDMGTKISGNSSTFAAAGEKIFSGASKKAKEMCKCCPEIKAFVYVNNDTINRKDKKFSSKEGVWTYDCKSNNWSKD